MRSTGTKQTGYCQLKTPLSGPQAESVEPIVLSSCAALNACPPLNVRGRAIECG
jgi:hypothetical protein